MSKTQRIKSDALADNPLEHWEQVQVCNWLDKYGIAYHAIPNGGNRSIVEAQKLKDEGVTAGVYDLFIMEPRNGFCGMYLEMKRLKGSSTSPEQRAFGLLASQKGYYCVVCKGHENALNALRCYLDIENELPF